MLNGREALPYKPFGRATGIGFAMEETFPVLNFFSLSEMFLSHSYRYDYPCQKRQHPPRIGNNRIAAETNG